MNATPIPPLPPPPTHPPQPQTCYARILDAKRRFLESALRYYELSSARPSPASSVQVGGVRVQVEGEGEQQRRMRRGERAWGEGEWGI